MPSASQNFEKDGSDTKYLPLLLFGPLPLNFGPLSQSQPILQSLAVILICSLEIVSKSCFMLEFRSLICIALCYSSETLRRCKDVQVFCSVIFRPSLKNEIHNQNETPSDENLKINCITSIAYQVNII